MEKTLWSVTWASHPNFRWGCCETAKSSTVLATKKKNNAPLDEFKATGVQVLTKVGYSVYHKLNDTRGLLERLARS